jgi:hypothetical protein
VRGEERRKQKINEQDPRTRRPLSTIQLALLGFVSEWDCTILGRLKGISDLENDFLEPEEIYHQQRFLH